MSKRRRGELQGKKRLWKNTRNERAMERERVKILTVFRTVSRNPDSVPEKEQFK